MNTIPMRGNQYIRGLSRTLLVQLICATLWTFGGWWADIWRNVWTNKRGCEIKKLGNRGCREEENHGSTGTDSSNELTTHSLMWRKTTSSWFMRRQRTNLYHASQRENNPANGNTHVFYRRPSNDSKQLTEVGHMDSLVSKIELP